MATLIFQSNLSSVPSDAPLTPGYDPTYRSYCPDYLQFDPDPDGQTGLCAHIKVFGGNPGCSREDVDKHRLQFIPDAVRVLNNDTRVWFGGYRLRIAESTRDAFNSASGWGLSHCSCSLRYNVIYLRRGNDSNAVNFQWQIRPGDIQEENQTNINTSYSNGYNRWLNIVWKLYQRTDNTGRIKLWVNGTPIIERNNLRTGGTWGCDECITKMGVYWGDDDRSPYTYEIYLDNWKIAYAPPGESEQVGFNMVNPATWGGAEGGGTSDFIVSAGTTYATTVDVPVQLNGTVTEV